MLFILNQFDRFNFHLIGTIVLFIKYSFFNRLNFRLEKRFNA
jgi:hypothetical protein